MNTDIPFTLHDLEKIKLISGRSNPHLSKNIAEQLGTELTLMTINDFGNTEIGVEIKENIRGHHVYIIQTGGHHNGKSINDHLIELFAIVNACTKSSAKTINIILPCYPYARSDKHDVPRVPIMGSCVANILHHMGVSRIVAMDLHAVQIQGFSNGPFENLFSMNIHIDNLKKTIFKGLTKHQINERYVLASPDIGGTKRVEQYAAKLQMKHVLMHKHRNYEEPGIVHDTVLVGKNGVIKDKTCIIIDDMFDTFGTIISASNELIKHGAKNIIAIACHGVFSKDAMDKINSSDIIERVIVTNTLPQTNNMDQSKKVHLVDISGVFADVIKLIQTGGSVSSLFE